MSTYMNCEITSPTKAELQTLFEMFDYNHEGILSKDELYDMMKFNAGNAGMNTDSQEFIDMSNSWLNEFTKPITFEYFEEVIYAFAHPSMPDECSEGVSTFEI